MNEDNNMHTLFFFLTSITYKQYNIQIYSNLVPKDWKELVKNEI